MKTHRLNIPADLKEILTVNAQAQAQWDDLTPIGQRDFISWINDAAQEKTRMKRIESIPSRLAAGKRRPCCYALVPMNLYSALGKNIEAKATWSALSPDQRRDFVDWINEVRSKEGRQERVDQACAKLAAGKRQP